MGDRWVKARLKGMEVVICIVVVSAWLVACWLTRETRKHGRP